MIVGIVTRSVRILFSHSTESRPAEGASNDDRSSVCAGLPRAIASATSRLRPPTCRTSAVPRFPPPSGALLSPVGIPRVTEAGRDRVEVPGPEIRQYRNWTSTPRRAAERSPSSARVRTGVMESRRGDPRLAQLRMLKVIGRSRLSRAGRRCGSAVSRQLRVRGGEGRLPCVRGSRRRAPGHRRRAPSRPPRPQQRASGSLRLA